MYAPYLDSLDVGIVADRNQMPDVHLLIDWLKGLLPPLPASAAASDTPAESAETPSGRAPIGTSPNGTQTRS